MYPAPLLVLVVIVASFVEWARQRFWTPRFIHLFAQVAFLVLLCINVWGIGIEEGRWMRFLATQVFTAIPYLVYLLAGGPYVLGRKRLAGASPPVGPKSAPPPRLTSPPGRRM